MHVSRLLLMLTLVSCVSCATDNERIMEHRSEFSELDPRTQKNIRDGIVEPGYTTDMVYMAMGRPNQVQTDAAGNTVWLFRHEPITANNETIHAGYRQRIVYDPVKRTDDVITEQIDTKAFPNLVPYTLRLTFQNGHLTKIDRVAS